MNGVVLTWATTIAVLCILTTTIVLLYNVYKLRGVMDRMHSRQEACEGDIMERETFRYQLYELANSQTNNLETLQLAQSISVFKGTCITMLTIAVIAIGVSFVLLVITQDVLNKWETVIYLALYFASVVVLYTLVSTNLTKLFENNAYMKCEDKECSKRSGVYAKLEKELDDILNKSFKPSQKTIYFMSKGFQTFGTEFVDSLTKRLVALEEMRANEVGTQELDLLTADVLRKAETEFLKVGEGGEFIGAYTSKLLPYLKLYMNKDRKDGKNDIEVIREKYRDWVCSHSASNIPIQCKPLNEVDAYLNNPLGTLLPYDTYPEITKKLESMGKIGWVILFAFLYVLYHRYSTRFNLPWYLSIFNFLLLIVIVFYYMMFVRYR